MEEKYVKIPRIPARTGVFFWEKIVSAHFHDISLEF